MVPKRAFLRAGPNWINTTPIHPSIHRQPKSIRELLTKMVTTGTFFSWLAAMRDLVLRVSFVILRIKRNQIWNKDAIYDYCHLTTVQRVQNREANDNKNSISGVLHISAIKTILRWWYATAAVAAVNQLYANRFWCWRKAFRAMKRRRWRSASIWILSTASETRRY